MCVFARGRRKFSVEKEGSEIWFGLGDDDDDLWYFYLKITTAMTTTLSPSANRHDR